METCRERLAREFPNKDCYDPDGCPYDYGYMVSPEKCPALDIALNSKKACAECWDRVIPEIDDETMETVVEDLKTPHILDSGTRREFETGAVRDIQEGKGRCDLLPLDVVGMFLKTAYDEDNGRYSNIIFDEIGRFQEDGSVDHLYEALLYGLPFDNIFTMLLEVSKHFEEGAKKYGENNWQKGLPVHCYINSAVRHYLKFLREDKDEPHDRAFCWNIMCAIWTCKHKPELNEYGKTDRK